MVLWGGLWLLSGCGQEVDQSAQNQTGQTGVTELSTSVPDDVTPLSLTAQVVPELPLLDEGPSTTPDPGSIGSVGRGYALPESAVDSEETPTILLHSSESSSDPLPFYEIARDTYMLFANISPLNRFDRGFNSNAGFVVTSEGVVVIDSLGTPHLGERLIATIASVTDQPITHLILTHMHPSHSLGSSPIAQLRRVTVITHPAARHAFDSSEAFRNLEYRRTLLPEDMQGEQELKSSRLVDKPLHDYTNLVVGEHTFAIYNMGESYPGGSLMVHQVDDDLLWLSDIVFNGAIPHLSGCNLQRVVENLRWLEANFAGVELMVPGHGSAQTAPFPMLEENLRYVEQLSAELKRSLGEGADLYQAVKQAELVEWRDWQLYHLNHRANANYLYTQLELGSFQ